MYTAERSKVKKEESQHVDDPDCDWSAFYKVAVGNWGMAPSEFWGLSPTEFWHIYNFKTPPKMVGSLTEEHTEQLLNKLDEAQKEWQAKQLAE